MKKERIAWVVAGGLTLLTVGVVAFQLGRGKAPPAAVPSMGNPGNATGANVRAPDISRMSPRERFDRLLERVMRAAEARQPDTVAMFAPMALGAYSQLDSVDTDARYHAAMIHLVVGEVAQAKAIADTIARQLPRHLFVPMIRGEAAEIENDGETLSKSYTVFLAAYDEEIAAKRQEYADHVALLQDFRNRALANRR